MRGLPVLLLALVLVGLRVAHAVQLDALDLSRVWRLRALRIEGNDRVRAGAIRGAMVTKPRPWFALWREYPEFDPVAFRTDLERVQRLYRNRAHYEARVMHDLELPAEGDALVAVLWIEEGPVVRVGRLALELYGAPVAPEEHDTLAATLPLREGEVFTQDGYDAGVVNLRGWYRQRGYARVEVTKIAQVDLATHTAAVTYRVDSGPPSVFGRVEVTGLDGVEEEVVRREIVFRQGEPFRQSRLDDTRDRLAALNLFSTIRIDEEGGDDPEVDYRVHVTELPPREIRLGIGYDTEEQVRGLASWRHYNVLGGGRQLGVAARASVLSRTLLADFLQPHFPAPKVHSRVLFSETQDDEDAFTLVRTRVSPRLEWKPSRRLTAYVFHRSEFDILSDVPRAVRRLVPGIAPDDGFLSGMGLGVDWNGTDDLFDPSRGFIVRASVEPVGGALGGDVSFVRLVGEGRAYRHLIGRLLGSVRVRLGAADPTSGDDEIPIFERFYAGGINSVRGYGRWRVGPLADELAAARARELRRRGQPVPQVFLDVADDPVGGRSLVEAAFEVSHPVTDTIAAAVFLDGGQVSLDSYDFPVDDLQYGTGVGARVRTPIGPLALDLAFPLDPRGDDSRWQVHVSLGAAF